MRGVVLVMLMLAAGAGGAEEWVTGDPRSALKRDVLCRGMGNHEKAVPIAAWCDGYAAGVGEVLSRLAEPGAPEPAPCIPGARRALWLAFGDWLVRHPEQRTDPAVDVMLRALAAGGAC